jgi:hypothetical protein
VRYPISSGNVPVNPDDDVSPVPFQKQHKNKNSCK